MIKVVLFDLDDTLYNERDFVYSGFMEVAKYINKKYKFNLDEIYKKIIEIFHKEGRGKIFNILCEIYSIEEDIEQLVQVYRETQPDITLYKDTRDTLDKLKHSYKLGIITDGKNTVQWNKIKALDVAKYIDKIIVTDDHGKDYWKPSEKPYIEMLEYFGGNPSEFVYIGDNPHKDFISCKKLGVHTIRIIRDIGDHMEVLLDDEYEADYNINSLYELDNILTLLNMEGR